jgi:hypothetical protein
MKGLIHVSFETAFENGAYTQQFTLSARCHVHTDFCLSLFPSNFVVGAPAGCDLSRSFRKVTFL